MRESKEYVKYPEANGTIYISEDVIAKIAASAALDTEGVAAMSPDTGKELAALFSRKTPNKGIRVSNEGNGFTIEVFLIAKNGYALQDIGENVQKNVAAAIESGTGESAAAVNVNFCGIVMNK